MNILLVAMPDTASNFARMIQVPNLGLCSLAGNLNNCEVEILDLALVSRRVQKELLGRLSSFKPEVVGLSAMTFQYASAIEIASLIKGYDDRIKTVLGGYHATLMFDEIASTKEGQLFDFLIRGEGEFILRDLITQMISVKSDFSSIAGLSYRYDGRFIHNPPVPLLDLGQLRRPDRNSRVLKGFAYLGRKLDCVETSRGCLLNCNFCSINQMYGRSLRNYSLNRVIKELKELKMMGVEEVLFVDDNITLEGERLKNLCKMIVENNLSSLEYMIQASVTGIAEGPELAHWMAKANFKLVFLGIESILLKDLKFLNKGDIIEKSKRAVQYLRENDIAVMGGFIVGNPDDTKEDIKEVFRQARKLKIDLAAVQCVTPYPKTKLREELLKQNLITNLDDFSKYNGFICNVRTKFLTNKQLNRLLNWENIKMFLTPSWFIGNKFVRKHLGASWRVILNNLEYFRAYFSGDLFKSRHKL